MNQTNKDKRLPENFYPGGKNKVDDFILLYEASESSTVWLKHINAPNVVHLSPWEHQLKNNLLNGGK